MQEETIYSAGDKVPESGIYQVMHYRHRLYHEATLLEGAHFPPCATCGDRVRFRLVHTAIPIGADRDFRDKRARARKKAAG